LTRLVSAAGLGAVIATAVAGFSFGASAAAGVTRVYTNDNTAGVNTVAGFQHNADGTLTALAGSPFVAGGAGTGTIIGSQGSLQSTADGRFILAADAGSNQISVLRIAPDGSLAPVDGSPFSSHGIEPISIAVHGALVYVANEGNGVSGSNYSGFRLTPLGRLIPIPGSTVALPATANPGDILFNSTGDNLVGVEVGTSDPNTFRIDSFLVGTDGRLSPAPGSPFPAQSAGPFGSEFSPTNPSHLYVSNAHAGAGNGSVSAFNVAADGSLSSIGASPYADAQTAPCWVEITHDGRWLFTVNTASTTISRFAILPDGSLQLLGSTPFSSGTGIRPFDARLGPSGATLYVVDSALDAVTAFAVDGGSLTELPSSPFHLPAGATPFGLVAI
jgi:6-phosphogluconolactonase (cycloisomerase 2 family)